MKVVAGPAIKAIVEKGNQVKPELDARFKQLAQVVGADFESRIKNPDTLLKKIAQHRLEGKTQYNQRGVNDVYGGRFIIKTPQQKKQLIQAINNLASTGTIKILKKQQVDKDTYHAYHMDMLYKGVRGELQIHDPQSYLEAVVNHDIRAKAGENPPEPLNREKKLNAKVALKMPAQSAVLLGKAMEARRRQNVQ